MFLIFTASVLLALVALFALPPPWALAVPAAGAVILTLLAFGVAPLRGALVNAATGLLLGWGAGLGWLHQHPPLPDEMAGRPVEITGTVVSLPVEEAMPGDHARTRFLFRSETLAEAGGAAHPWQRLLRLSWRDGPALHAGERWRLRVRLYPVQGMLNPGGFDYEAWALAQGWRIRGGVQQGHRVGALWHWQRLREHFRDRIASQWRDSPFAGLYDALTFGARERIAPEQWQVLQLSGTSHLMAISGLHIGLAAGLGAVLFAGLWRWLPFVRAIARPQWAALGAVMLAGAYLLLSGAGLPAQRAFVMVAVAALLVWLRRPFLNLQALALAAVVVALWQPASVLSASFWLSFAAVAVIIVALRHARIRGWTSWQQFLLLQFVLLLALWPLTAFFFDQAAGWRGMVNLLAVPLVSFFYLPLLALASVIGLFEPAWLHALVPWLDGLWRPLWELLQWTAQQSAPALPSPQGWMMVLPALAFAALVAARVRLAAAGLGVFFLLWLSQPLWLARPSPGEVWVTVLDVGQGQALVLETRDHVLLYDAGPRWLRLDTGAAVVVPFLHARGRGLDAIVASHDDRDHVGGLAAVRAAFPHAALYSGQPQRFDGARPCVAGDQWSWDGVTFRFLWPPPGFRHRQDNAHSCVLQVQAGGTRLLITGDLPAAQERRLVGMQGDALASVWMMAGHHGSASSNSLALLRVVRPQQVAVSAGFGNFFHFPAAAARARWQQLGIRTHCTGCEGALQYRVNGAGVTLVRRERLVRDTIFRHHCREASP